MTRTREKFIGKKGTKDKEKSVAKRLHYARSAKESHENEEWNVSGTDPKRDGVYTPGMIEFGIRCLLRENKIF
jgi:hypothetical protein